MTAFGSLAASDVLKLLGGIALPGRRFARIGTLLLLCLAAGLGLPQPTTAAPPPSPSEFSVADLDPAKATFIPEAKLLADGCGSTCDGQNPATFRVYTSDCGGCYRICAEDARTVASRSDNIILELRYSNRCRTAWTRVGSSFYYPTIRSYYLNGNVRAAYSDFAGPYYTVMVNDAGLLARAEAVAGPTTWYTSKY